MADTAGGDGWQLFPYLTVRRAGFPYRLLERLQVAAATEAARSVERSRTAAHAARTQLRAALAAARAAAETESPGPPAPDSADFRRWRRRAHRAASSWRPVEEPPGTGLADPVRRWNDAAAAHAAAREAARRAVPAALAEAGAALRGLAADPRFEEAVFLNSPQMVERGLHPYLRDEGGGSRQRARELTVLRYLQRFCAKNDSVSFFGPMDYGRFDTAAPDGVGWPGSPAAPPAVRRVWLSHWAAEEVAAAMARDPRTRPDRRAVRSALVRPVRGGLAAPGLGLCTALPAVQGDLVAAADGSCGLAALAERLGVPVAETVDAAEQLAGRGLLWLGFPVRAHTTDSFEQVEAAAAGLSAEPARAHWQAGCGRLRRLVRDFEAAGYPARAVLLDRIEAEFGELTGRAARRSGGELYADRLLVYEECVGGLGPVTAGGVLAKELADRLSTSLDLLGSTAHRQWLRQAAAGRAALARVLDGRGRMPLLEVLARRAGTVGTETADDRAADDRTTDDRTTDMAGAGPPADPGDPWRCASAALLAGATGPRRLDRRQLADAFGELAVPAALIAAPDLMICAPDREAIARGDYQIVLGEVHPVLLATHKALTALDPALPELLAAGERLLERLVAPEQQAILSSRRISKIDSWPLGRPEINLEWAFGGGPAPEVPLADVDVVLPADGLPHLVAAGLPRPLHLEVPLVTGPDFPDFLLAFGRPAIWHRPLGDGGHSPRVEIDGVVFQRERWELGAGDLPAWRTPYDHPDNLVDLWSWRADLGLPEQVFCRLDRPGVKPFLVDFRSPLSCVAFVQDTSTGIPVVLTEMLPGPEDLWLRDGDDRFTCEVRFNAWRPAPAAGPSPPAPIPPAPVPPAPVPPPTAVAPDTFADRIAGLRALVEPLITED